MGSISTSPASTLALMASSAVSIESWSSSEAIRQLIRAGLEALRRKMGPGR
jgi:hypothetical protein